MPLLGERSKERKRREIQKTRHGNWFDKGNLDCLAVNENILSIFILTFLGFSGPEVDQFYANNLSRSLFMSVKQSRDWQIFQWYDGITPQYHWDLEEEIESAFKKMSFDYKKIQEGCYRVKVHD